MSWILAFLGFAALIVLHELGHFAAAKWVGMRVERFSLFFPPLLARRKRGETEYAIGAVPLGGYVKITGMNPHEEIPAEHAHRAYFRQPVWKRVFVIAAGPAVNIFLAFLILWCVFIISGFFETVPRVDAVEKNRPATGVLLPGDRIVAVDGVRSQDAAVLAEQIRTHTCTGGQVRDCRASTPAVIEVERNGESKRFEIRPFFDGERHRLGFSFDAEKRDPGPVHSASLSVDTMWLFTKGTVETIARIFEAEKRKEISGVVGSYETTRQSIERSTQQAFFLLAVISLSLGIINLFPFLPLDGGHIFWALAEKIRGRAIPFRVMEQAGFVGFALVIALFMIGLTNDIGRLQGEGFDVR